ncbi:MAG: type II secretion system F family protein [Syntrophorhabdaceae bacterium]|nr:type II secretion system F family protein [Syntrophorhabdaceae bacterium]
MKTLDILLIGLLMLVGGTLVTHSSRKLFGNSFPRRFMQAYKRLHLRFVDKLIKKKVLRMPGIHLADPVAPFACGELAGLAILLAAFSSQQTAGLIKFFPIAFFVGAFIAWVTIASYSKKALDSVRRDLPIACFLLSLLLESGMGTSMALQETAASIPRGPLSMELSDLVASRTLGISKTESIRRSGERVPIEDYRLFLNHILQGERLGIGLSKSLRGLSSKMLENQDHRAETIAQQAGVKLLLPLACFIFPAVFLIILSPMILGFWNHISR